MKYQDMVKELIEHAAEYFAETGDPLQSPDAVGKYLSAVLLSPEKETFGIIYVNAQNKVIKFEAHSTGTVDMSVVYPREVVKRCLELNATGVIMAHNHPGGGSKFSADDERVTKELKAALGLFNIRALDHVLVCGPGQTVSMQELGMM